MGMSGGFAGGLAQGLRNGFTLADMYEEASKRRDEKELLKSKGAIAHEMSNPSGIQEDAQNTASPSKFGLMDYTKQNPSVQNGTQPQLGLADIIEPPKDNNQSVVYKAQGGGLSDMLTPKPDIRTQPKGGLADLLPADMTTQSAQNSKQSSPGLADVMKRSGLDTFNKVYNDQYSKLLQDNPLAAARLAIDREKMIAPIREEEYRGALSSYQFTKDPSAFAGFMNNYMTLPFKVDAMSQDQDGNVIVKGINRSSGQRFEQVVNAQDFKGLVAQAGDPEYQKQLFISTLQADRQAVERRRLQEQDAEVKRQQEAIDYPVARQRNQEAMKDKSAAQIAHAQEMINRGLAKRPGTGSGQTAQQRAFNFLISNGVDPKEAVDRVIPPRRQGNEQAEFVKNYVLNAQKGFTDKSPSELAAEGRSVYGEIYGIPTDSQNTGTPSNTSPLSIDQSDLAAFNDYLSGGQIDQYYNDKYKQSQKDAEIGASQQYPYAN